MMGMPITMFATIGNLFEATGAWKNTDVIAGLLTAIFLVTLGIGLVCLCLVIHFLRTARSRVRPPGQHRGLTGAESRFRHPGVSLPCRWLAIKSSHPSQVQEALRLSKPTRCSWAEAMARTHERKLFISPPVDGWILVLGSGLPDPAADVDRCYLLILELSRKLGHVQFFSFNRALNHHAWAQASHGQVLRAYAWAGQTLWNEGPVTRAEFELQLKCFQYAEPPPEIPLASINPVAMNTDKVPLLAARWSIDPAAIDPRGLQESHGIAGQLSWRKSI